MSAPTALFRSLLPADDWARLAPAVRRMHGEGRQLQASGQAVVEGARSAPARVARWLLRLPEPGSDQALRLTIERDDGRETWTRHFSRGRMRSTLHRQSPTQLRERLGPVALHFQLQRDGDAIDWQLRRVTTCGLPLPRALLGRVVSRSGASDGRYAFHIDVRLPLLGQLVAYRGWLEIDHVR